MGLDDVAGPEKDLEWMGVKPQGVNVTTPAGAKRITNKNNDGFFTLPITNAPAPGGRVN